MKKRDLYDSKRNITGETIDKGRAVFPKSLWRIWNSYRRDLNWNDIPMELVEKALEGAMINVSVFDGGKCVGVGRIVGWNISLKIKMEYICGLENEDSFKKFNKYINHV